MLCPIHQCSVRFTAFVDLRLHMEYDHGMWYLAKEHHKTYDLPETPMPASPSSESSSPTPTTQERTIDEHEPDVEEISRKKSSVTPTPSRKTELRSPIDMSPTNIQERSPVVPSLEMTSSTSAEIQLLRELERKDKEMEKVRRDLQQASFMWRHLQSEVYALRGLLDQTAETLVSFNDTLTEKDIAIQEKMNEMKQLEAKRKSLQDKYRRKKHQMKKFVDNILHRTLAAEEEVKKLKEESMKVITESPPYLLRPEIEQDNWFRQRHIEVQYQQSQIPIRVATIEVPNTTPFGSGIRDVHSRQPNASQHEKVLLQVFQYLDTSTLLTCACVSRLWRDCSHRPQFWKTVTLSRRRVSPMFLSCLAQWCTQTETLKLDRLRARTLTAAETMTQYIERTRGILESGLETLLRAMQYSLTKLSIVDCGNILTERSLWLASCFCRHLEQVIYLSDTDPAGPEVLWSLGAGCRLIHTLIIPPLYPNQKPQNFNNSCMTIIARAFPHLRILCVGGHEVDTNGLLVIAKACEQLRRLELSHMVEVREKTAIVLCQEGLKNLVSLDFTFTPVTPKALLHFYKNCRNLQSITVNVSLSNYFPAAQSQTPKNVQIFQKTIENLKALRNRPRLAKILEIIVSGD